MHRILLSKIKVLGFIRLILASHIVPWIRYHGFTLEGRWVPWIRRRVRTMCGSRTGGWSLPGVMSDWQRCVDWLLAKYCWCKLRLDRCWCRWRTSVKGRRWWGLQVWRRQVGLVRGTRWPAVSSVGRMVARTTGRIRGRFLGWASKPRSSRDYVGSESWVAIGGGYTELAGFAVVHQKTTGLLGWATKPRPKTRRGGAATQARLTAQEGGLTAWLV
jgi:hypothetical protein